MHGVRGVSGLNEGTSITVFKTQKNLGETIFGTVLYYRDIGISGYPSVIPIGTANDYDKKGLDFMAFVMAEDETQINWLDPVEVQTVFELFWEPLNRNVPWEQWLVDVDSATAQTVAWLAANR
jgi:hypothetical protein